MEQLSNYQSAHIEYIGSDALSTALAVYLGPLSPELRLEFINHHWSKCLKERGIKLNWSSTEKVLIPSVTDEVGQSVFSLDHGESPAAPPTTGNPQLPLPLLIILIMMAMSVMLRSWMMEKKVLLAT